ncbi:MAG: hypothetical protein PHP82_01535 [Candidatus ainarchaeum sp.]|nr:hypothetical protein [Candidatus ainarchaeum sp.]
MNKKNIESEKEIEKILKEKKIKFNRKKKLILKKDSKKFRIPDFYLPEYDLAIEYFGSWNNKKNKSFEKKERARFMEKVGVYEESGLNCLYLYPEDTKELREKILKKIDSIDKKRKTSEITKIILEKKTIIKPTNVKIEEKPIIKLEKNVKQIIEINLLVRIILGIGAISIFLFILQLIITIWLFLIGNPFFNELHIANDVLFFLFSILILISIVLSALFAFEKSLSKGFFYVSMILIIFFFISSWFFGDPLIRAIIILISVFGIIPSEYFMIKTN